MIAMLGFWALQDSRRPPTGADRTQAPLGTQEDRDLDATLNALAAESAQGEGQLQQLAQAQGSAWAAPTLALLADNLKLVDLTIAQIRQAWEQEPRNSQLAHRLLAAYLSKVRLQECAWQVIERS